MSSMFSPDEFCVHVRELGYRPPSAIDLTDEFQREMLKYF